MLALLQACGSSDPAAEPAPATPPPERPDILLITLDTLRADALGAYGNPRAPTPVLDQVARDGVRFDRAHCAVAMCAPFRQELYSGRTE